jgi:hypothetical protein
MYLTHDELNLFAELLDPLHGNEEHRLLRDRIETYLYVAGYYDEQCDLPDYQIEYMEGCAWRTGEWHAWDGLHDAYGRTAQEALDELHRGRKP